MVTDPPFPIFLLAHPGGPMIIGKAASTQKVSQIPFDIKIYRFWSACFHHQSVINMPTSPVKTTIP